MLTKTPSRFSIRGLSRPAVGTATAMNAPSATATAAATAASEAAAAIYVVKKGDTLWDIARAQLGDATLYTKIVEMNGLAASAVLAVGQELKLPK